MTCSMRNPTGERDGLIAPAQERKPGEPCPTSRDKQGGLGEMKYRSCGRRP